MNPFDTTGFPARWFCGSGWSEQPWVGWLHISSDIVIFLAYFAVPAVVMYFVSQRDDLKFPPIFYGFLGMIFFSCGTVHLIEAWIFWWPVYKLSGLAKFATAGFSASGVILLTRVLPTALELKSGSAYRAAVEERQRAESELQLTSNRLKLATKAGRIGVWDYDIVNNVLVWDENMFKVYGVEPDQFSGVYEAWESVLHPDDKDAEVENLQKAIRGEETFDTEFRVIWPQDGSVHFIKADATVLRDESGEAYRMIGVNWDNTKRRLHEDQLRLAMEKAEAAAEAKSEFLANMSHEIRTPMNGIMGMTELLMGTDLQRDQQEYLGMISESAESLLSVINDILDFSKIEAGKLQLDPHEFNLRESIGQTLQAFSFRAEQKGIELACHVQPDVADCLIGDLGRIRQVLVNLVGNALKFTEQGEIVVEVQLESQSSDQVSLHFLVKDTGMGISPEKREAIFESFTQAENSTTRTHGGTGLGLTIAQNIVELMNGRIWVESEPQRGSTFHFTVLLGRGVESGTISRVELEDLKDLSVLVIDDNLTNRKILNRMLLNWNMSPQIAAGGREALEKLTAANDSAAPFQLILLDLMMPEMDGLEVAGHVRAKFADAAPAILMLSSAGSVIPPEEAARVGIADVLTKPIMGNELLEKIQTLFGTDSETVRDVYPVDTIKPAEIPAMKLLLAEDGKVNRLLAVKMLEKRGHTVVVAENGEAAVEIYQREPFDAILMDVQMPKLDGFAATRAIREHEQESGGHIPIIAMTANAMKGDREKCLESGMDDYIAKPIRSQELFPVLEKFAKTGN